jgi:hypothetical protein
MGAKIGSQAAGAQGSFIFNEDALSSAFLHNGFCGLPLDSTKDWRNKISALI